jgi:predicted lipid-binding transport protein (Tim44 family)
VIILEILFFAGVAGFFLFRLFQVLGKTNDEDHKIAKRLKERRAEIERQGEAGEPSTLENRGKDGAPSLQFPDTGIGDVQTSLPGAATEALRIIMRREPGFSAEEFLDGAKSAYSLIIDAFAQGQLEELERFLTPTKFARWREAIVARQAAGHRQISDIVRLVRAEIVQAVADGGDARIGVRYEADLSSAVTDADGKVLQGDASRIARVNEVWTFVRHLGDPDPNWRLESVKKAD